MSFPFYSSPSFWVTAVVLSWGGAEGDGGGLTPQVASEKSGDVFLVVAVGQVGCSWQVEGEARDAAEHPSGPRTAPPKPPTKIIPPKMSVLPG